MFQFPRCPPDISGAQQNAGRVAPFGHPRITGCQRLPGAFRRVAASFFGRRRQGIHHAPIIAATLSQSSIDRHSLKLGSRTGARSKDLFLQLEPSQPPPSSCASR